MFEQDKISNGVDKKLNRITEAGNIKNKIGEIASASPRKTNYKLNYA